MEVRDGFIVGIFNYCDRWCERCPLTNRCRMFADLVEVDFERGNGPLPESRMLRERRRLAVQMIEIHAEAEELREAVLPTPGQRFGHLPADMETSAGPPLGVLASAPSLHKKLHELETSADPSARRAIEVIKYFSLFVPMKMIRAIAQVARNGPGDQQSDANGSGKAALLGLEQMERAWTSLIETHHVSATVAAPFLEEIGRMQRNLNRALPCARTFIRPGLDEPDDVKMLNAAEC